MERKSEIYKTHKKKRKIIICVKALFLHNLNVRAKYLCTQKVRYFSRRGMNLCIFLLQSIKHLLKMRKKYDAAEEFWRIFKRAFFEIGHANTGQARKASSRSTSHNTKHQKKEKTKLAC